MSRRISAGDYHVGLYCGTQLFSYNSWRLYGLFRRTGSGSGFSIGPVLFWKEDIK